MITGCAYRQVDNGTSNEAQPIIRYVAENEVPKVNKNLVEVIRCKDCKWHYEGEDDQWYCDKHDFDWIDEEFYCKSGRRR